MSARQQPRVAMKAAPYKSSSCSIGTHRECAYSSPAVAPVGVPVIYEACDCSCHPTVVPTTPREVAT